VILAFGSFNFSSTDYIQGFDGVNFDIEDYFGNVPSDFASQVSLLYEV
jgi:hypothetical protein